MGTMSNIPIFDKDELMLILLVKGFIFFIRYKVINTARNIFK